ncbi:MAG TPA: hypothetical protein VFB38_06055 [Chthonomonadaceae bacterium]|nr:hypothetical protein [Chthonomonadaceae bacterium]
MLVDPLPLPREAEPEENTPQQTPPSLDQPDQEALPDALPPLEETASTPSGASPEALPDVLPPLASQILALLWILLFAGRWVLLPALISAGVLSASQVAQWNHSVDDGLLVQVYLALLVVTVLVLTLRVVRRFQAARPHTLVSPAPRSSFRRDEPSD